MIEHMSPIRKFTKQKQEFNGTSRKWINKKGHRSWIVIYSIYLIIILLSATVYYAEQSIDSRSNGIHDYTIIFNGDGEVEHYKVKLFDKSEKGVIEVAFDYNKNQLDVKAQNILELEIDCRSIAEEKTKEILGYDYEDNENAYKQHFIQKNLLEITVNSDNRISLTLKDIPHPSTVMINQVKSDFTFLNGRVVTTVPEGKTEVDIYFTITGPSLSANFVTGSKYFFHLPNTAIDFDASSSTPKESIVDYLWDFGDGSFGDGVKITHTYTKPGFYQVVLVVRDSEGRINRGYGEFSIFDSDLDKLPDDWEMFYFKSLSEMGTGDYDNDKLNNANEYKYDTNPNLADSDNDNFNDGYEINKKTDPLDPESKPDKKEAKKGGEFNLIYIMIIIIAIIIIVILLVVIRKSKKEKVEPDRDLTAEELSEPGLSVPGPGGIEPDEEPYQCPECGSIIEEDQKMCYDCGAVLEWDELDEEEMGSMEQKESLEYTIDTDKSKRQKTEIGEEEFEEEFESDTIELDKTTTAEGEYECPTCGETVGENDMVCPVCGEEFE